MHTKKIRFLAHFRALEASYPIGKENVGTQSLVVSRMPKIEPCYLRSYLKGAEINEKKAPSRMGVHLWNDAHLSSKSSMSLFASLLHVAKDRGTTLSDQYLVWMSKTALIHYMNN